MKVLTHIIILGLARRTIFVTVLIGKAQVFRISPSDRGAYLLVIRLSRSLTVRVGALGLLRFKSGWYVYVGSSLNGLSARVARHFRLHKVKRWHIDYLRPRAHTVRAFLFPSHRDIECILARKLCAISNDQVLRFGSSDCTCPSHLFHFRTDPTLMEEFRQLLKSRNGNRLIRPSP
jgi:sugar fermentation stimulation protein A